LKSDGSVLIAFFLFIHFENFSGLFFETFVFFETDPNDDQEDENEEDDDGGRDAEILIFAISLVLKVKGEFLFDFTCQNVVAFDGFFRIDKDQVILSDFFTTTIHVNSNVFIDGLRRLKIKFWRRLLHEISDKFA
jgi:hypothetical protein